MPGVPFVQWVSNGETLGGKHKGIKSFALKRLKSVISDYRLKAAATALATATPRGLMEMRNVWALKFTEDEISCHFSGPHMNVNLDYAVRRIVSGDWAASDFPPMNVVAIGGSLWCLDNRRLWIFRKAVLQMVPVIILSDPRDPQVQNFVARATKSAMERWEADNFEPKVRGRVHISALCVDDPTAATTQTPGLDASQHPCLSSGTALCPTTDGLSGSKLVCFCIGLFVLIAVLLHSPTCRWR
ncbi:hypothetical protein Mapa_014619 [Marchantia paleacea]|nr:hypothetical protein Mapa_014619 [Marchantia paleacea]